MTDLSLKEEFDRLVKIRDIKRQEQQEAKVRLTTAEERLAELGEEAKKHGVEDLSKIDEIIEQEEKALREELNQLSNKLGVSSEEIQNTPVPSVSGEKLQSIDDLLDVASQS